MKYLIMVLDGPMQSWGIQGKFDVRETSTFPTKSGVVGLLSAALGIQRKEKEKIQEIASLHLVVMTLKSGEIFLDYHTVGCKDEDVPTADGKSGKGVVTERYYLGDAEFVVVMSGNNTMIDACAKALENPHYTLSLGRKCCVPTRPVLENICCSKEEVLGALKKLGVTSETPCLSDCGYKEFKDVQQDVPVGFRKFDSRYVSDSNPYF